MLWWVFAFGSFLVVEAYFWTGRSYRLQLHFISPANDKKKAENAHILARYSYDAVSKLGEMSTKLFALVTETTQHESQLSILETNAVNYLNRNLLIHALGELFQAILLCGENSSQLSKFHRLKAESYMLMNAPDDAIRELYRSLLLIYPVECRSSVLQDLHPLLTRLFPLHAAVQSLDNIQITRNVNDLIFISSQDLTKYQLPADTHEIVVKLQLATTLLLKLLKARSTASVSPISNKIMTPRRYRLAPGQDRYLLTMEADLRLTANITSSQDIITNTRLDFDATTGQYRILAARNIQQGDVVFIEPPIVSLWSDYNNNHGCSHCWKPLPDVVGQVSCSSCGERYCSRRCHDLSQAEYHQALCGDEWRDFIRYMDLANQPSATGSLFCLAVKVTAMAHQQGVHPLHLPRFRNLIRKSDNSEIISDGVDKQLCESLFGLYAKIFSERFVSKCPSLVRKGIGHAGDVMEVADAIKMNVFGWAMNGIDCSALQHVGSLLNHHCNPTAQNRFNIEEHGLVSIIEAMRDIKAGEEVSISYVDTDLGYDARQEELINQFSFVCRCFRCTTEAKK